MACLPQLLAMLEHCTSLEYSKISLNIMEYFILKLLQYAEYNPVSVNDIGLVIDLVVGICAFIINSNLTKY